MSQPSSATSGADDEVRALEPRSTPIPPATLERTTQTHLLRGGSRISLDLPGSMTGFSIGRANDAFSEAYAYSCKEYAMPRCDPQERSIGQKHPTGASLKRAINAGWDFLRSTTSALVT